MVNLEKRLHRQHADYLAAHLLLPWCFAATLIALLTLADSRFDGFRVMAVFGDALSAAVWLWRRG